MLLLFLKNVLQFMLNHNKFRNLKTQKKYIEVNFYHKLSPTMHTTCIWHTILKIPSNCRKLLQRPTKYYNYFTDQKNGCVWCTENFPRKEKFVKCDWPTQIFRRKKILKLKIFSFNNDIFGKFSVRGKFSWVEMGLNK